jgi:hypothetical protein
MIVTEDDIGALTDRLLASTACDPRQQADMRLAALVLRCLIQDGTVLGDVRVDDDGGG